MKNKTTDAANHKESAIKIIHTIMHCISPKLHITGITKTAKITINNAKTKI